MYKVFISERPLIIRPREGADVELKGGELHFHCSENEDIIQLISLLEDNPQVKSVHAYNNEPDVLFSTLKSHFSVVEAAGGLVQNKKGAYLFIFRRGKWDLPKGKIDKGESEEDAAVREVSEECGIPLPASKKTQNNARIFNGQDAAPMQFPWQVFLEIKAKINGNTVFGGAVLVSKKHILATAHAFHDHEFPFSR